jgi:cellulose synthase/poly-beta-1,6-N-acetylglucosamine synthase-like glycosyltransferase
VIIPLHNEEKTIEFKLRNLLKSNYPEDHLQIILADDASTDKTLQKASDFLDKNPGLNIRIVRAQEHLGKANVLNMSLKFCEFDIVAMSDADSFWAPDALTKLLPYLSDPTVGAVIGQERLLNPGQSWITQTEKTYVGLVNSTIRLGESKIHSNIFFHGLLAAYKKRYLESFNAEIDDSGTALDIVQKGVRTLSIPDAQCFDVFPATWRGKTSVKARRASQLIQLCAHCLKLLVRQQLLLPKKIALPEIFLFLFNPAIFMCLLALTPIVFVEWFPISLVLLLVLFPVLFYTQTRSVFVETLQNNLILLIGLITFLSGKKFVAWETLKEPRSILDENMLQREGLI